MNQARLLALAAALALTATTAQAQLQGFGRPTAGVYGGYSHPNGDFKSEAGDGWHAGALIKMRAYGALDLRVDGGFSKFAKKNIPLQLENGDTLSFHTDANVAYGTLAAHLNLGPDSAAYPGDNTITPHLIAGIGLYHLDYKFSCTGACTGVIGPDVKTNVGFNLGGGVTVPLAGLRPFLEARYHRISRNSEDGDSRTFLTVSAGIKIR